MFVEIAVTEQVTGADVQAAALQYVRKISGFHRPAAHHREPFERAVEEIAESTARLLAGIQLRGSGVATSARDRHDVSDPPPLR